MAILKTLLKLKQTLCFPLSSAYLNHCKRSVHKLKIKYLVTLIVIFVLLFFIIRHGRLTKIQNALLLQIPETGHAINSDEVGQNKRAISNRVPCPEQKNIVYIKAIKCASETLTSIFRRFGNDRNLSFVLPPADKIYLGWPYEMIPGTYRESKTGGFNILCEHAVYQRDRMRKLMPKDTLYITSVRHPFSQFKSLFHYYNFVAVIGLMSSNPVKEYLLNISRHEAVYKSEEVSKIRYCIPNNFSMTQNLMSFNLGLPPELSGPGINKIYTDKEIETISHWLDALSNDLSLVLVVEYFVESLVLLRRKLCWSWKDIFFMTLNNGSYTYRDLNDPQLEGIYKSWSRVDYLLYDRFNGTLWKQIRQQSADFSDEVKSFKLALQEGQDLCHKVKPERSMYVIVPRKEWSPSFYISFTDCEYMLDNNSLLRAIKYKYEELDVDIHQPPVPDNMTRVC